MIVTFKRAQNWPEPTRPGQVLLCLKKPWIGFWVATNRYGLAFYAAHPLQYVGRRIKKATRLWLGNRLARLAIRCHMWPCYTGAENAPRNMEQAIKIMAFVNHRIRGW